ncbi:hypothetical protein LAZ67_22000583 [Cordylochernes scorpioides]|uniref:Transposase n=1 Tax=Cordylochernes scorpioides TaxID=51811 RepID=A0ABY6LQU8_9ARAC|nr:hypothetical protein LAZ67_22000583 [Cordylochernes scorpioides]
MRRLRVELKQEIEIGVQRGQEDIRVLPECTISLLIHTLVASSEIQYFRTANIFKTSALAENRVTSPSAGAFVGCHQGPSHPPCRPRLPSKSRYLYAQVRSASVSMELPLVNVSTCKLRSVIRFFTAKNETAVNIHPNLVSVYSEGCMSIQMVRRWPLWFLEGWQNVHDNERSGWPVAATDNAAVAAVRNVVEADRRVTIDEIMIRLPPGIEIDALRLEQSCQICVPRLLSENHKQQRMEAARAFLEMHRREGDQLFSHIVTGDESWLHHSTPETKRQSMVWKKPEESAPKEEKVTFSAGKVMAIVFWDCNSVLLVDYLPPNITFNAERYCEVLSKLRAAIKWKRPGLLSRKVLLVHDNARPHAARTTQTLLENFKWEIFTHPHYSPVFSPSDFHLFPALKFHLGGKHFANDDEVEAEANQWLRRQDTAWYKNGIKNCYNGTKNVWTEMVIK